VDHGAVTAARSSGEIDAFILRHEGFLIKCASSVSRRHITRSDEEWSVTLSAFTEALESYDLNKGSFLSFAELIIRRRLIDFFRKQARTTAFESPVDPLVFESDLDEDALDKPLGLSVVKKMTQQNDGSLSIEIETANATFGRYGFAFMDLTTCSPQAWKTKTACATAIAYLLKNPDLIEEMRISKLLPIKQIEQNTGIPRKLLERHRKYLIAATEILSGDYPFLAEYLSYVRKEEFA
jgi:RNA polymerase sigma factor